MSAFTSLLNTTVAIVRSSDAASFDDEGDDLGHPARSYATLATVAARIEPKQQPMGRVGSVQDSNSDWDGTSLNDFVVFIQPTDVTANDRLVDAAAREYKILQVRDAAGAGHHYEIDARRIIPDAAA